MKSRLAMAVVGSFCFVFLLVAATVVYDIETTPSDVRAIYEDVKLIDILTPKRKHTPIDDFMLTYPEFRTNGIPRKSGAG